MTEILIPARRGRAVRVPHGAAIDVINSHGTQVVDFWALCSPNTSEHLSTEHTRIAIGRLVPRVGDTLVSHAGDLIRLRAETDLVVIMPACPQDLTPVNGAAQKPTDAAFQVHHNG